jgi:hypothetical protein
MTQTPSQNWRTSVAAVLDLLKKYHESLSEVTAMAYAVRRTAEQLDGRFASLLEKNYRDITSELSAANHLTQHLLEKIAGQLRDDPNWKD